jgi:hypothetical protein
MTVTARWWPTPESRSAASVLRVEVAKNSFTAGARRPGYGYLLFSFAATSSVTS